MTGMSNPPSTFASQFRTPWKRTWKATRSIPHALHLSHPIDSPSLLQSELRGFPHRFRVAYAAGVVPRLRAGNHLLLKHHQTICLCLHLAYPTESSLRFTHIPGLSQFPIISSRPRTPLVYPYSSFHRLFPRTIQGGCI